MILPAPRRSPADEVEPSRQSQAPIPQDGSRPAIVLHPLATATDDEAPPGDAGGASARR